MMFFFLDGGRDSVDEFVDARRETVGRVGIVFLQLVARDDERA